MPDSDVFAIQNSGYNSFLQASVGTDVNGSLLTVLSALARLGDDPWKKAASWARMPAAGAAAALAACIAEMPLQAQDLQDAPATASRLIGLLSAREAGEARPAVAGPYRRSQPKSPVNLLAVVAVLLALAATLTLAIRSSIGTAPAPAQSSATLAG